MPSNDYVVGALYLPGGPGGFWTQPGGVGTPVLPRQVTGGFELLTTEPFNELTGAYIGICSHSFLYCTVYRDIDVNTGLSVAILTCPLCSCVQRTISPFEAAIGPESMLLNAILYP